MENSVIRESMMHFFVMFPDRRSSLWSAVLFFTDKQRKPTKEQFKLPYLFDDHSKVAAKGMFVPYAQCH